MNLAALKELMVLRVVEDHPAHGYALSAMLADSLGWTLGFTRPTTYAVLQRLEQRGWLVSEQDQDGAYPERRTYALTEAGREGYAELLERTLARVGPSLQPLPALLLHLDELPGERRARVLEDLRTTRRALLEVLRAAPAHEGAAGAAFSLMQRGLEVELETIEGLARTDRATAPRKTGARP